MPVLKLPISPEDHAQGPADAPVTLVEYGDYQCPYCGRAYPIVKAVQKHFGTRVRFVFRNFPLRELHEWAEPAADTAEFAAGKGAFWPMHDLLYENQRRLGPELFAKLTEQLGFNVDELETALEEGRFTDRVKRDFLSGVRSGVNGTPTFFINGHRHDADFELPTLIRAIDAQLLLRAG